MSSPPVGGLPNIDAEDLFEHAPVGYVITDGDWKILRVNQTLLDWLHLEHEDLVETHFSHLLTAPGRIYHETHYAPLVLHQGQVGEVAADLTRRDAAPLPVLLGSHSRGQGAGGRIRTSLVRVEERRRYESELLAARRRAEDSEQRTHALHDAVARLVGATTEEHVAASLHLAGTALPGALDASAWMLDKLGELREVGRKRSQPRRIAVTADHPAAQCFRDREVVVDRRVNMLAVPLGPDEAHGVFSVAMASIDGLPEHDRELITTLARQAGQALERIAIHRRRQDVLHAAARDLHLPLTVVVGHAASLEELLEDRLTEGEDAALRRLHGVAQRMQDLVADFLELARIEEGHVELVREPHDVGPILHDAAEFVRQRTAGEGVSVQVTHLVENTRALVDPEALRMALTNLLTDAVNLTPRTEHVTVAVTATETTVDIVVTDLGAAPLAEGDWVQASTSDAPARSAIGHTVARGFVEAMGGHLVVEDTPTGGTVEVRLRRA